MQQTRAAPSATLDAVLERITYANQDTGYTVARVATDRSSDLLTVVGPLLGAQPGESLRLRGRWTSHPQYGRQFQVDTYDTVLPATIQGIRRYLGSGLIKGIGPKMAERIVDHFGQATLQVIEEDPKRLVEVPGLGPKRTAMITAAWAEQQAIKEVMVFLQGVGVSTSLAVRIYKNAVLDVTLVKAPGPVAFQGNTGRATAEGFVPLAAAESPVIEANGMVIRHHGPQA
jgi:exodeoxyribonuclease V alpha subunit